MKIYVVGIGPGSHENMTLLADSVLRDCDVIVGYTVYIDLIREYYSGKKFIQTPMTKEVERCIEAYREALRGNTVAVVCSGDAGVYGMAALMYEVGEKYDFLGNNSDNGENKFPEIVVVPGITAALSGAALLGAPLTHDFAVISLSDLLTPWELIEKRLLCAAMSDMSICIYNPSSKKRYDYLQRACDILLVHKNPETVCGVAGNIARDGEYMKILTLKELRQEKTDMFSTIFIGNSQTRVVNNKMVTPRGYKKMTVDDNDKAEG